MKTFDWNTTHFFFDIDDTLIDTSAVSIQATIGIYDALRTELSETHARRIAATVNRYYGLLFAGHRVNDSYETTQNAEMKKELGALMQRIKKAQQPIQEKYHLVKKWSREVYIALAAEEHDITISPELVRAAANSYWQKLSQLTAAYDDAVELAHTIRTHTRPIHLATSSDARLLMQADGTFAYDPQYSEQFKRNRVEVLRDKGIDYATLTIGDPEDKPNTDFFQKSISAAEKSTQQSINLKQCIMIGDSFDGDLKTPQHMGFGCIVLIDRAAQNTEWLDDNFVRTNDLREVTKLLR